MSDQLNFDIEELISYKSFKSIHSTTSTLNPVLQPICTFRRALDSDIEEIQNFYTSQIRTFFGNKPLQHIIKKCFFSLVACNADEQIVAVICLHFHPNIPSLLPSVWEPWVKHLYNLYNVTSQNTLWIHLLACHPHYAFIFVKPLLEIIYVTFPLLIHILCVAPGDTPIAIYIEENFSCIMPIGYTNPRKVQTLYLTVRYHYTKKYKVRLAVEEDNDDIVPLIDKQSARLKQMYGEYYVSEILTKHPDSTRKIIVAEIYGRAVAVLFLNDVVNYSALCRSFNLEPFCNLHIFDSSSYIRRLTLEDISLSGFMALAGSTPHFSVDENQVEDQNLEITDLALEHLKRTQNQVDIEEHDDHSATSLHSADIDLEAVGIKAEELFKSYTELATIQMETLTEKPSSEEQMQVYIEKSDSDSGELQSTFNADFLPTSKYSETRLKLSPNALEAAFTLEIIAAEEEHESTVMCDLLEASFHGYSENQFCVFSTIHNQPHFPLLDYFVKIPPLRAAIYPQELYVLHKNTIKANLVVRKMKKHDYKEIKILTKYIEMGKSVHRYVYTILFTNEHDAKAYVMLNYFTIVGFIIIQPEIDIDYYMVNYNIYSYLSYEVHKYEKYGLIQLCLLSPLFYKHTQFFLREIHRLTDMSILFYKLDRNEVPQSTRSKPLPGIIGNMIPVKDCELPVFNTMKFEPEINLSPYLSVPKTEMFALYVSTPRLCSLPRIDVNSRLVVVGASNTGLSFLETLIFHFDEKQHVIFNNLNLVYNRIVRDSINVSKYAPLLFVNNGIYSSNHLNSVCYHTHVNMINSSMIAINRKNKYITLENDTILPYDYLFLMCGQQFHHPYEPGIRYNIDKVVQPCPKNVFVINKFKDAERALKKLHKIINNKVKYKIIVYGSTLRCYCCIATLQKMKIPNSCIVFVEPYPDENERPSMNAFNNAEIYEAVQDILDISGIETYRGFYFYEWDFNPKRSTTVSFIKFQSRQDTVTIDCDAVFFYGHLEVDYATFMAINRAGLVYDGKLVIGPDCRTNDPFIFAAGTMTKYSRKYFADKFLHKYYDSHEIGERLALQIRAMLLPGGLENNKGDEIFKILESEKTNKLVPYYNKPKVRICILPGKLNYLDIKKPGKIIPLEKEVRLNNYGVAYVTGNLHAVEFDSDPKYFRINIDYFSRVAQITCLTKQNIDVSNMIRIWGKHEKYLNNLSARFAAHNIKDFYEFFRQPNFCALYMDKFNQTEETLTTIVQLLTENMGESLIEDVLNKFWDCGWKKLSERFETEIQNKFDNSEYHKMMVKEIMNFVGENYNYLPMYAHPLITKIILYDIEDSPIFWRTKRKVYKN